MQAPLWWGIWLQHGTRLSTFQQLTTTRPTSTSASSILEHVATWNWYSNLTIDGSIYPSEHFAFGAVFVCQTGNLWTQLRISLGWWNYGMCLVEIRSALKILVRKPEGWNCLGGTRHQDQHCAFPLVFLTPFSGLQKLNHEALIFDLYRVVKYRMHEAEISCLRKVVKRRGPLPLTCNTMTIEHLHKLTISSSAMILSVSMAVECSAFPLGCRGNWNYGII